MLRPLRAGRTLKSRQSLHAQPNTDQPRTQQITGSSMCRPTPIQLRRGHSSARRKYSRLGLLQRPYRRLRHPLPTSTLPTSGPPLSIPVLTTTRMWLRRLRLSRRWKVSFQLNPHTLHACGISSTMWCLPKALRVLMRTRTKDLNMV